MSGIDTGGKLMYKAFEKLYKEFKKTGEMIVLDYGECYYFNNWMRKYHPDEQYEYEELDSKDFFPRRYN